jgi:hypothetical protein
MARDPAAHAPPEPHVSAQSAPLDARPCHARLADKRAPCPAPVRRRYEELSIPMRVAFPGTVLAML